MENQKQIHDYIQSHKKEIVDLLKELISIPSVAVKGTSEAPYGKECAQAMDFVNELYQKNGFATELDHKGGYLLSYFGEGEKSIGIFAHADVVPAGDDWIYTKPFEPLEKDGCIIGRGSSDDKSGIIISLFAAKAIKELNLPFNSRLVLFAGCNEETGMDDIENYLAAHKPPDYSIVADSDFPLFRGDKGILRFMATSEIALKEISDFNGGSAFNIILGEVTAKYKDQIFVEKGLSKHGAYPEGSVNAAYLMAKKLSQLSELDESDKKQMLFVEKILEKYYGEVYSVENIDPDFGRLTITTGIARTINGRLSLSFDMRYGACVDIDDTKRKIAQFFSENNWTVEFEPESKPAVTEENHPFVQTCLGVYQGFTGDTEARAQVNAGATYAKHLPCAVEIGLSLDNSRKFDLPIGHGDIHQPDEYINIKGLLDAIELVTLMLIETDKNT